MLLLSLLSEIGGQNACWRNAAAVSSSEVAANYRCCFAGVAAWSCCSSFGGQWLIGGAPPSAAAVDSKSPAAASPGAAVAVSRRAPTVHYPLNPFNRFSIGQGKEELRKKLERIRSILPLESCSNYDNFLKLLMRKERRIWWVI
ncbi:uncharacterized protein LOC131012602 [Salvia miltiorrhiza]|uniref:uncharacterized protein LOC131012602 n=1 Tax=Salvia miltiorrhiza TaxID=226208 RepID=UPI0025AC561E|nr:uncharacterized protein LOC131012602 [Salvia miltiorrhiza]